MELIPCVPSLTLSPFLGFPAPLMMFQSRLLTPSLCCSVNGWDSSQSRSCTQMPTGKPERSARLCFPAEACEQLLTINDSQTEGISPGWCCPERWLQGAAALFKAVSANCLWAVSSGSSCAKLGSWVLSWGLRSLGELCLCWNSLPDCVRAHPPSLSQCFPFLHSTGKQS